MILLSSNCGVKHIVGECNDENALVTKLPIAEPGLFDVDALPASLLHISSVCPPTEEYLRHQAHLAFNGVPKEVLPPVLSQNVSPFAVRLVDLQNYLVGLEL